MEERQNITVIDYGVGNIQSICNAFKALGTTPTVVDTGDEIVSPDGLVLPGVGAFPDGMEELRERDMVEPLERHVLEDSTPFLGVCLGMQLLAERGTEHGDHKGLGWIEGTVERIHTEGSFEVPHMGWNETDIKMKDLLFDELPDNPTFYYVHSYQFVLAEKGDSIKTASTWHGTNITASVRKDNVFGVQFHPEKSQAAGLKLLENFLLYVAEMRGD